MRSSGKQALSTSHSSTPGPRAAGSLCGRSRCGNGVSSVPEVMAGGRWRQLSRPEARCCWHAEGEGWWVEKIAPGGGAGWRKMWISSELSGLQAGEGTVDPRLSEHLVAAGWEQVRDSSAGQLLAQSVTGLGAACLVVTGVLLRITRSPDVPVWHVRVHKALAIHTLSNARRGGDGEPRPWSGGDQPGQPSGSPSVLCPLPLKLLGG